MKAKRRKFTEEERREVERLTADGFRGKHVDVTRCAELYAISPDEYGEIGERVRKRIRAEIMGPWT